MGLVGEGVGRGRRLSLGLELVERERARCVEVSCDGCESSGREMERELRGRGRMVD